jgi:hypothetical protein
MAPELFLFMDHAARRHIFTLVTRILFQTVPGVEPAITGIAFSPSTSVSPLIIPPAVQLSHLSIIDAI